MSPIPITFETALARTETRSRHLLLGNGFSIGLHASFGYPDLFRNAVDRDPAFADLFRPVGETNFEVALANARDTNEAGQIRDGLIRSVATVHPRRSWDFAERGRVCRKFLHNFAGRTRVAPGSVFTTNYDILLQWVIAAQERTVGAKRRSVLRMHDGFDHEGKWHDGAEAQIFYLHGAVHIYELPYNSLRREFLTQMLRYERGKTLLDQVEALLAAGDLPVFVAEGTAGAKVEAQRRWAYLRSAMRQFKAICADRENVLFSYGHSFGSSDEHITRCIGAGTINRVCIGVFSGADQRRANQLTEQWTAERRARGLEDFRVYTFDSRRVSVWEDKSQDLFESAR